MFVDIDIRNTYLFFLSYLQKSVVVCETSFNRFLNCESALEGEL